MAQSIRTNILINATTSGFAAVGNTLTELGSILDGLSSRLIEFGKESVEVYKNYESSMADAEVAMSTTYGRNTKALNDVMKQLDSAAAQWASTTIFHTDDVANAIAQAAHAGWDLDQMMEGIPSAMKLAQAGSMDLAQAVDYIVKSTSALGMEFDDTEHFIDIWTYAANTSATNIEEVGEAMLRMGGTMRFTENNEELLTMLATLGDAGTTGEAAGTLLRNSMLRLIAPTKKAKEVMASLGVEGDEINAIMEDTDLAAANAELSLHGFSAYTDKGKLKPMLTTFKDLYKALVEINGGTEDLFDNDKVNSILSTIFPTRSITGAMALLNAAAENYGGLYDDMMNGAAEGYGDYAAQVMMDTLEGAEKIFLSKVEELQRTIGEGLSPDLKELFEALGKVVDRITSVDDGSFSTFSSLVDLVQKFAEGVVAMDDSALGKIVDGVKSLAFAGPLLLLAGGGFRLVGTFLHNPWLAAAAGITAVAVSTRAAFDEIEKFNREEYEAKFGEIELDPTVITNYVHEVSAAYSDSFNQLQQYNQRAQDAFEQYTGTTGEMKRILLENMLTDKELDPTEQQTIQGYADSIATEMDKAIKEHYAGYMGGLTNLFGGPDAAKNDSLWTQMMGVVTWNYGQDIAKAEQLSKELRDALTEAFDGTLTAEEVAKIQGIFDQMNELMAAQIEAEDAGDRARLMSQMQGMGADSVDEYTQIVSDARQEAYDNIEAEKAYWLSWTESYYKKAIEEGLINPKTNEKYSTTDMENALAKITSDYESKRDKATGDYNQLLTDMFTWVASEFGLTDEYADLQLAARAYAANKGIYSESIWGSHADTLNNGPLANFIETMTNAYGGFDQVKAEYNRLMGAGLEDQAEIYGFLLNAHDLFMNEAQRQNLNPDLKKAGGDAALTYGSESGLYTDTNSALFGIAQKYGLGNIAGLSEYLDRNAGTLAFGNTALYGEITQALTHGGVMPQEATLEATRDAIRQYVFAESGRNEQDYKPYESGVSVAGQGLADATGENASLLRENALSLGEILSAAAEGIGQAAGAFVAGAPAIWDSLGGMEVYAAEVGPSVTEAIEQEQPEVTVDAITDPAEEQIGTLDDEELVIPTTTDIGPAEQNLAWLRLQASNPIHIPVVVDSVPGAPITSGNVAPNLYASGMFHAAEGGRATVASIFGEAGPEWAIPEQHTDRTAELLNAARAASGFTWTDLISRFGGLGANANNKSTTLVYSPTINAGNAQGIEQALIADKARLERWWEDRQTREAVEVYA